VNEDYLWDKSGEPDPEIQRLENLLSPLGHKLDKTPALCFPKRSRVPYLLAIAASFLVLCGALWIAWQRTRPAWDVATVQGTPSLKRLAKGESISTDGQSQARLNLNDVGEVEVEPNTRLSVLAIRPDEQRLALERGTIHALIWAPPGRFIVNTPSAQTVDLGCQYTLKVDADGVGLVQVSVGWVAFENDGRESFIPADAACITRPGKGPGIPYYQDASREVIDALHRFDADADQPAIAVILAKARQRDAISLWHLLRRVQPDDRGRVYDRLAQFITVPAGVTREGVLAADPQMIDSLWNTLDLGNTSWWRMWKSRGPK
jgi:FecR protein